MTELNTEYCSWVCRKPWTFQSYCRRLANSSQQFLLLLTIIKTLRSLQLMNVFHLWETYMNTNKAVIVIAQKTRLEPHSAGGFTPSVRPECAGEARRNFQSSALSLQFVNLLPWKQAFKFLKKQENSFKQILVSNNMLVVGSVFLSF